MQWQGKSTNFSTNQVPWIGQSNISWKSENWIYEPSELTAYDIIEDSLKKLKTEIKKLIEEKYKNKRYATEMNDKGKGLADISTLTGVSNWLAVLPIREYGFELCYSWENMQSTNILSLR